MIVPEEYVHSLPNSNKKITLINHSPFSECSLKSRKKGAYYKRSGIYNRIMSFNVAL